MFIRLLNRAMIVFHPFIGVPIFLAEEPLLSLANLLMCVTKDAALSFQRPSPILLNREDLCDHDKPCHE
jgi:hypothetical protein